MENRTVVWKSVLGVSVLLAPLAFIAGMLFSPRQYEAFASISCVKNTSPEAGVATDIDFSPFWRTWQLIDQKYVGTGSSSLSTKELGEQRLWGAITGMVEALGDPYTEFLPPEDRKSFEEDIRGSFGGVGMELGIRNDKLTVVAPLPGTPAARAGIRAGDVIVKIEDIDATGMNTEKAVKLIRGNVGTTVTISIIREGLTKPLSLTMTRATITVPVIKTEQLDGGIFLIRLYSFSENSTRLFRDALLEFIKSGNSKLILDLRGNPGGYLDAAVNVASWFLPEGAVVVREQKGPGQEEELYRSVRAGIFTKKLEMVILVDTGSASASEIVAGALKEYGVATLIGEQTFGKGSVQELIPVNKETSLKVTIAQWLTPQGHSISKAGLTPDIVVPMSEEDIANERDPQLERAKRFLRTGK